MINGHGDDLFRYGNIVANFSSNVYNDVDHTLLWEHLKGRMECMVSYPEPQPYTLEGKIAGMLGTGDGNVCVTNGATEAIYLVAQCFCGCRSVIFVPTFSEYSDACRVHSHSVSEVTVLEDVERICREEKVGLVWICNPNNPTGRVVEKGRLVSLIREFPGVVFVLDQSYAFFTREEVVSVGEGIGLGNVIMLHSMTKRYAVPGVRLGYITADEALLERIKGVRMPWAVNAFAIETGLFLLQNDISATTEIPVLLEKSRELGNRISALGGGGYFQVEPTHTHYMLVKISRELGYGGGVYSASAAALKEHLANNCGILIRDASNFATLGEGHFRIATQRDKENEMLIEELEKLCI